LTHSMHPTWMLVYLKTPNDQHKRAMPEKD
jgi:hypothetical protein